MRTFVSIKTILEKIHSAVLNKNGFEQLRNFIFDYFAAEEDDEYIFESESTKIVFDILGTYLEFEEAYNDPLANKKLKRLKTAIEIECSPEIVILAIYMDEISMLVNKLSAGMISEFIFERQLRKLSPIKVKWKKVLKLYELYSRLLSEDNLLSE